MYPVEITQQGWAVLKGFTLPGCCSDDVRRFGRIDCDRFDSINLCRPFFKPDTTTIDIGANIGCWSVPMGIAAGSVISFEPNPDAFACLKYNLSRDRRIKATPLNTAAWETSGTHLFVRNEGNLECSAMLVGPILSPMTTFPLEALAIDDLDTDNVSFIKVDVEGAELQCLRGAEQLIKRDHPVLFIETQNGGQFPYFGYTLDQLHDWIKSFGYCIKSHRDHDLLCVHNSDAHH